MVMTSNVRSRRPRRVSVIPPEVPREYDPASWVGKWLRARGLEPDSMRDLWGMKSTMVDRRPAFTFPTPTGTRVQFVDSQTPTTKWGDGGYEVCWYGADTGYGTIFIVATEEDVWRSQALGLSALCACGIPGAVPPHMVDELADWLRPRPIRVVFPLDRSMDGGAVVAGLAAEGLDVKALASLPSGPDEDLPGEYPAGAPQFRPLEAHPAPPEFPLGILPTWAENWARAKAAELQVRIDLTAMLAVAACAAAAARRGEILVRPGWTEPLSICLALFLPSGEAKSPAFRAAFRPIHAWESDAAVSMRQEISEATVYKSILEGHVRSSITRATKTHDKTAALEAVDAQMRSDDHKVPVPPRLIASDATPEALISLLAAQGGTLCWASTEADLFSLMLGRYGNGPNFDNILKATSGDPIRVDRKGRITEDIAEPALSVIIAAQPSVLTDLAAAPGQVIDRGLVPRFHMVVPSSLVGRRRPGAPATPPGVEMAYRNGVGSIIGKGPLSMRSQIHVSPEALACLDDWYYSKIEPTVGPGCKFEHMAAYLLKLRGSAIRLAGVLVVLDRQGVVDGYTVDVPYMERAIELVRYLAGHTRLAWDRMQSDPQVRAALRLWRFVLKVHADGGGTERDLHRAAAGSFRTVDDLAMPLDTLKRAGYLASVVPENAGPGRRPSPCIVMNPEALAFHSVDSVNGDSAIVTTSGGPIDS